MSDSTVTALLALHIAMLAKSPTPAADRTFIAGMVEAFKFMQQLTDDDAAKYLERAAVKCGDRVEQLRAGK